MPGFWILIGRVGMGPDGMPPDDLKKLVTEASVQLRRK